MAITRGDDTNRTNMLTNLMGIYYYILDRDLITSNSGDNTSIFNFVPSIQSISYNPFLSVNDENMSIIEADFDKEHWGNPSTGSTPKVYRLRSMLSFQKSLMKYNLKVDYHSLPYDYETRLLFYPFKYYTICDYLNPPLTLKPELIKVDSEGNFEIKVSCALSQTSKYQIFVTSYKNDFWGNIEGMTNNNPLLFPVGSSAYASFLATSGNTFNQINANNLLENDISFKQNVKSLELNNEKSMVGGGLNLIGSLLSGNIGGAIQGGVNTLYENKGNKLQSQFNNENHSVKEFTIENMALAKTNDYLNTPRTMRSMGNDATFNIGMARNKVDLIEYGLQNEYESRISSYFKRYGYRVNRYGLPYLKTRKYWNFVKLTRCNIDSSEIPYSDLQEIESIFESGITLWHVENEVEIKNYQKNNMEV